MWRRSMVVGVVSAVCVAPSVAVAGIGAHSTAYWQTNGTIEIAYQRVTHVAEVLGGLQCLGTIRTGPDKGSPARFDDWPLRASHGKIHYAGETHNFPGTDDSPARREIRISLTLKPHLATGTISFPGTTCGVIKIAAKAEKINP